ncbi:hypothetical protein BD324DRAFT_615706 [Kockovaella imperatae]|uniref:Uncharacterized protein n=1 Tax=Kockovaella imperatae TaxID=4999 RepID=A0A1Y1UQW2_9TREE|nr:hypothetical protein BD324DRAFT_615706 [Kockovaella imperatae]ORX39967.1 hypothetical protein BD324DRAFT_615706 [Kockovaella imperatae]
MLSNLYTLLFTLLVSSAAMADRTVRINAVDGACIRTGSSCGGGMTLQLKDDGTPYPTLDYHVGVPGVAEKEEVGCHWEGKLDDGVDQVTFTFSSGPDYLYPCGPQKGITMVCDNPPATCASTPRENV